MIRRFVDPIVKWTTQLVRQPLATQTRWQRFARFNYDLARYGAKQLNEDRANQMAAALAFRTLFGLLPVLIVATVLARALMGPAEFKVFLGSAIEKFVANLNLDEVKVNVGSAAASATEEPTGLGQWLQTIVEPVSTLSFAALTWAGIAVLIYSAIGLMVTIENSFNTIYRAPEGRSWAKRVPMYWFVLTMAPLVFALTTFLETRFDTWVAALESGAWLVSTARVLWSFVLGWLVLTTLYALVPNTNVAIRPAVAGAFIAAIIVEILKRTLGAYIGNAISFRQIYGSLGLIPIFMFWVYVMWLVILFGLEVASTLQSLHGRRLAELERKRPQAGVVDPASVIYVMQVVVERFHIGQATSASHVADQSGLPETTVAMMMERLTEVGLLHRLAMDSELMALSKPAEGINLDELMRVGFSLVHEGDEERRPALLQKLREAQAKVAQTVTLAALAPAKT